MAGEGEKDQQVSVDTIMAEIRLRARDLEKSEKTPSGSSRESNDEIPAVPKAGYVVVGARRRFGRWIAKAVKACYPIPVLGWMAKRTVDYLQLPRRIGYIIEEVEVLYDRIDALEREVKRLRNEKGRTS